MVIERLALPVPLALTALTVATVVPGELTVPLMTPVEGLRLRPVGSPVA